jgi:polyisoprenyl-teichoic acid--peptidoglycan teichoic acid transferase
VFLDKPAVCALYCNRTEPGVITTYQVDKSITQRERKEAIFTPIKQRIHRILCAALCLVMLTGMPLNGFATDAAATGSPDDSQATIDQNSDLTDAEKQQWAEWAVADANGDTQTAEDEENAAMVAELQDALDESEMTGETDASDLEINAALPSTVINILLLGVDNRSVKLESGLSDAIIICSINTEDGSIKLTSITRDTEINIPGYKTTKRINCAFKFGSKNGDLDAGAKLAMKTINRNFQMNLQRYVVVNIHGLADIIDALGGLDMDMSTKEASRINYELRKEPMDSVAREKVKAIDGVQHLDGMQAVTYARIRGIDNDFMRTERQRKLLETLLEKVMEGMDITKFFQLIQTALPYGATNMTAADMISLGALVLGGQAMNNLSNGTKVLEQFRIPMDGTYKYIHVDGASFTAFRTDARKQENIDAMQEFIYGQTFTAQ